MRYCGLNILLSSFFHKIYSRHGSFLFCTIVLMCLILNLLLSQVLHAQKAESIKQEQDTKLVWSAKNYGQGEQIYYSSFTKNKWTTPVQLSHSADLVFQPASSSGTDGKVWVVWSRQDKNGSFIQFTVYSASGWLQPRQINTGIDNNKAVAIIVDHDNTPWIAWTAIDDIYPEIFWSRWNGQGWDLPVRAHDKNKVPDIQPALALDESGNINLSWQTYLDGKYVIVSQVWKGQQWQTVSNESEKIIRKKLIRGYKGSFLVPDFVEDSRKASLFIKRTDGAGSLPLSLF
ncbi:MAG: hypothetical protein KKB91_06225 [Proteobacteria bacterium]|nr:hypothetical protein [Pseudomonadota bacterium]